MHIEVPRILDRSPRDRGVLRLYFLRKLSDQFPDLDDAHTAGVLKEKIRLKSIKAVLISVQVIRDTITLADDLFKEDWKDEGIAQGVDRHCLASERTRMLILYHILDYFATV